MFKKIFSYIIPLNIYRKKSTISKSLEVTWANGKLVLDSQNTNYSYGSLQRILKKGLYTIGYDNILSMQQILVLGVAGGSVIKTLIDEIKFKGQITGVDIDKEIIDLANEYFNLNAYQNLSIHIMDAFEFVLKTKIKYDLIIIDVFQDTKMPNFLFEKSFIQNIENILNKNSLVLFNTMILNNEHNLRNEIYGNKFNPSIFSIEKIPRVEQNNELIIIRKKQIN